MSKLPQPLRALAMWEQGKSYEAIAKRLGCTRSYARDMVSRGRRYDDFKEKQRKIMRNSPKAVEAAARKAERAKRNDEIIRSYFKIGHRETARQMGISPNIVAGVMKRWRARQADGQAS